MISKETKSNAVYHIGVTQSFPKRLTNSDSYTLFLLKKSLPASYWYLFRNDVISNVYPEALCNGESVTKLKLNNTIWILNNYKEEEDRKKS